MTKSKFKFTAVAAGSLAFLGMMASAQASTVVVNQFDIHPGISFPPLPDLWYFTDMRANGTASTVDLTGVGGNLENNQPLPTGAALLTTGMSNDDKAEVGTFRDFGKATTVLDNVSLSYDYFKQSVPGGNIFAAPALKIGILSETGTGDNYGQLVYEPYWNQPGGGAPPAPADAWQSVTIDSYTGQGPDTNSGGWWWTGGFNVANGAGGPPLMSLREWVEALGISDPDFADARVVSLSMAVGTYNQGQVGYFDEVSISIPENTILGQSAFDRTYDFEVPEPASLALMGLGGLMLLRRR